MITHYVIASSGSGSSPHAVTDNGAMLYQGNSGKGASTIAPP